MNVLFITYGLPYPPHSGARVRDYFLLREIAKQHHVTCVCLLEQPAEVQHIPALEQMGISTFGFELEGASGVTRARSAARHLAAGYPLATLAFWSVPLFEKIKALTAEQTFDLVQIEHSFLVPYLDALPADLRHRAILDLHNIGAEQYRRMSDMGLTKPARAGYWLKTRLMQNWEVAYAARFARVLTVSDDDAKWLCSRNPAPRVSVIENGTDTAVTTVLPPAAGRNTLLFVGTLGYPPNADALVWFCNEILPIVRQSVPDVSLEIVGHAPGAAVRALGQIQDVKLYADVADVQPYYEKANVVIVPLRAGGGTRLKILEAMAFGRAVVSTPIGSKGLNVEDGVTLLLADTAHEFAARVIYLLQHPAEQEGLARRAREQVEAHYTWEKIGAKLRKVYAGVAG